MATLTLSRLALAPPAAGHVKAIGTWMLPRLTRGEPGGAWRWPAPAPPLLAAACVLLMLITPHERSTCCRFGGSEARRSPAPPDGTPARRRRRRRQRRGHVGRGGRQQHLRWPSGAASGLCKPGAHHCQQHGRRAGRRLEGSGGGGFMPLHLFSCCCTAPCTRQPSLRAVLPGCCICNPPADASCPGRVPIFVRCRCCSVLAGPLYAAPSGGHKAVPPQATAPAPWLQRAPSRLPAGLLCAVPS